MRRSSVQSVILLSAIAIGGGCGRSSLSIPREVTDAGTAPNPSAPEDGGGTAGAGEPACRRDSDCGPGGLGRCESGVCREPVASGCERDGVAYPDGATVLFECEICSCDGGFFACTQTECLDAGEPELDSGSSGGDAGLSCEERAEALGIAHLPSSNESLYVAGGQAAQTFKPRAAVTVSAVVLPLYTCRQNFRPDAQAGVVATGPNGAPDLSQVLAWSQVVASGDLPGGCVITFGGHAEIEFRFDRPVTLAAGTLYAVVLASVGPETGEEWFWRRSADPPPGEEAYADGQAWLSLRWRRSWQAVLDRADLAFTFIPTTCEFAIRN